MRYYFTCIVRFFVFLLSAKNKITVHIVITTVYIYPSASAYNLVSTHKHPYLGLRPGV